MFKTHASAFFFFFFLPGVVTTGEDGTRDSGKDACLKIIVCEEALK